MRLDLVMQNQYSLYTVTREALLAINQISFKELLEQGQKVKEVKDLQRCNRQNNPLKQLATNFDMRESSLSKKILLTIETQITCQPKQTIMLQSAITRACSKKGQVQRMTQSFRFTAKTAKIANKMGLLNWKELTRQLPHFFRQLPILVLLHQ